MKKRILHFILLLLPILVSAQMYEVGFSVGNVNYVGDVGNRNYFQPKDIGMGFVFKRNYRPHLSFRANYNYFAISAKDQESNDPVRVKRDREFKNDITEIALGIEYNFFKYAVDDAEKSFTPYLLLQIAGVQYDNVQLMNSKGEYKYKTRRTMSLPFGIGIKSKITYQLAISLEARVAYLFEDDLDFSTRKFTELNFVGIGNDWYNFIGLSFTYVFGKPPCYCQ